MAASRYLTAQKISLLVLVNLYCNSALPLSATIPVLSFILSHAVPSAPSSARARRTPEQQNASFPIQSFEDVLQSFTSNMPGRTLLDVFLKHLWEINSFDALYDLFNNIENLLAKGADDPDQAAPVEQSPDTILLSRTSPLGAFVRRARIEFVRLQFDDALKLWSAFILYRAPTAQWTTRTAGLASSGFDHNATELGLRPGEDLYEVAYGHLEDEAENGEVVSMDDLERLLEFQLERLQRLGCRVPEEMRTQIRSMLSPKTPVLRQSHIVRFFDAWKAGDYTSAFENLHQYYDYATQTREKVHYQYALLHMAILQADFGCFGEAIAAINETIATARENQDMNCLNFSLSWLNHMSKAYPKQLRGAGYMGMLGSERDGLTFLKAKAKETKMYHLLGATLLNEARLSMSTGDSVARALEHMYQASHLNIRENLTTQGGLMLLESTLYSRLSVSHISSAYSELVLHCYQQNGPVDEQIRAICRSAISVMQDGNYDNALQQLETIPSSSHRTLKFHQYIFYCTGLIKLKRAIHRTDWTLCSALLPSLRPDHSSDPELSFLLSEAHIDYLIACGHFSSAFSTIEDYAAALKAQGADILQRITMLLLKGKLFAKVGKPEAGFSIAMRAASVAYKARLMPSLWQAVGLIANVLNALGEFAACERLLDAVIPQALEDANKEITAALYCHLGDSYIGLAGFDDPATSHGARARATKISRAEMYIDRARDCYKKIENIDGECEQLMKKALIAKLRGDEQLAENWAENHNRVWEEGKRGAGDGEITVQ